MQIGARAKTATKQDSGLSEGTHARKPFDLKKDRSPMNGAYDCCSVALLIDKFIEFA